MDVRAASRSGGRLWERGVEWSGGGDRWKTGPPGTERADCGTAPPHGGGDHPDDGRRRRVKVGQPREETGGQHWGAWASEGRVF